VLDRARRGTQKLSRRRGTQNCRDDGLQLAREKIDRDWGARLELSHFWVPPNRNDGTIKNDDDESSDNKVDKDDDEDDSPMTLEGDGGGGGAADVERSQSQPLKWKIDQEEEVGENGDFVGSVDPKISVETQQQDDDEEEEEEATSNHNMGIDAMLMANEEEDDEEEKDVADPPNLIRKKKKKKCIDDDDDDPDGNGGEEDLLDDDEDDATPTIHNRRPSPPPPVRLAHHAGEFVRVWMSKREQQSKWLDENVGCKRHCPNRHFHLSNDNTAGRWRTGFLVVPKRVDATRW
jgi:hypothetical protein